MFYDDNAHCIGCGYLMKNCYCGQKELKSEIDKLKAELAQTNATLETFKEADTKWRELYESVGRENAALKELVREIGQRDCSEYCLKYTYIIDPDYETKCDCVEGKWNKRANDVVSDATKGG